LTFPSPADLVVSGFRWVEYLGLLGFIGVIMVRRLAANQPTLSWARIPMHPALAIALNDTIVPDFPLANKSFNLSYAGNDL